MFVFCLGLSFESNPDVVGEPDHGHPRVTRSRHGDAQRGDAQAQAVRENKATYLAYYDEEHYWSRDLSTHCYLCHSISWSVFLPHHTNLMLMLRY